MSDDHSRKRPQDDRGIRDVQLPLAVPAESLAEKVRRLLGEGTSCPSLGEERCPLWVKSGHFAVQSPCPLCANSGHCASKETASRRSLQIQFAQSRDVFQPRCLLRQHSRESLLPLLGRLRHGFIEICGLLHRRHRACAIDFPSPGFRRAASALHDERVVCRVKSFFLHAPSNGDGWLRFQTRR